MKLWISVAVALSGLMLSTLAFTLPNSAMWLAIGLNPALLAFWIGLFLIGLALFIVGAGLSIRFHLLGRHARRAASIR